MKRKHLKRIAKYLAREIERRCEWQMNLTLTKRVDDGDWAGEWTSDGEGGEIGLKSVEVTPRTSGYMEPSESSYTAATLPPKHVPFDKPGDEPSPVAPPGAVSIKVPGCWLVPVWSTSCVGYRGWWHPSIIRDADGGIRTRNCHECP